MIHKPNIVLLAGGTGQRLWPISNYSHPKQFIKIPILGLSTFQLAIKRSLNITSINKIIITTNVLFHQIIKQQIEELGLNYKDFSLSYEAEKQDTAKTIYNYCANELKQGLNFKTIFFPTDHILFNDQVFFKDLIKEISWNRLNILAEKAKEICYRFGYLYSYKKKPSRYFKVSRFIEKPCSNFSDGKDLYRNIGIYLTTPSVIIDEFYQHYCHSIPEKLSIDKAIAEKSNNLFAYQVEFDWEDIGSLECLYNYFPNINIEGHKLREDEINNFNNINQNFRLTKFEDKVIFEKI